MDAANFRHMVKDRSKNDIPYDPTAAGEKVWYTKPSERSVCREYLLALLRGDLVVPHWKPTAFYKCLLDGLEYEPPVKHLKLQLRDDWDPDDMHAGAVSKPLKASKPPRKRAVRQLENEDDECVDADSLASPASPDALLVPDLVEVPAVLDAGAGAMPPEQMSSSSSSRSSSSSTSSSSDSSESAERSPSQVAASDPESDDAPVRRRGQHKGEAWGVFRLTAFNKKGGGTGFQMTCTHPKHQGRTAACTKSRSNRFAGGDDACIRMLKQWALAGASLASKREHQAVWNDVMQAYNSSSLRSMDDLDSHAITSWANLEGQPSTGAIASSSAGRPATASRDSASAAASSALAKAAPEKRRRKK